MLNEICIIIASESIIGTVIMLYNWFVRLGKITEFDKWLFVTMVTSVFNILCGYFRVAEGNILVGALFIFFGILSWAVMGYLTFTDELDNTTEI